MILIDDGLAVRALAGRGNDHWLGEVPTVPWFSYLRLLSALRGERPYSGRLSHLATPEVIEYASSPPQDVLQVTDPRPYTALMVDLLHRRHRGINKLSADFLAAAIHYETAMHVIEGNVGAHWEALCDIEGVELRIIRASGSL